MGDRSTVLSAADRKLILGIIQAYALEKRPESEFEIRLRAATHHTFAGVYNTLVGLGFVFEEQQTVNSLEDYLRSTKQQPTAQVARSPNHITTFTFKDGVQSAVRKYTVKSPLCELARTQTSGLDFVVTASSERPVETRPTMGDSSLVRIKRRMSTPAALDKQAWVVGDSQAPWRLDLTIVVQISGSQCANHLSSCVDVMFRTTNVSQFTETALSFKFAPTYEIEAEWVGKSSPQDTDVWNAIIATSMLVPESIRSQEGLESETRRLAQAIMPNLPPSQRSRLKTILPQVLGLTQSSYSDIYPPVNYYITEKADGARAVAHLGPTSVIVTAQKVIKLSGTPERTIIDGELVGDTFCAFDVMVVNGLNVMSQSFEERIEHLATAVAALTAAGGKAMAKKYQLLSSDEPATLEAEFNAVLQSKEHAALYETDGIILVKPGASYANTESWKWKPPQHNTIDFLAKSAGGNKYYLFVGMSRSQFVSLGYELLEGYSSMFKNNTEKDNYFPVQFAPRVCDDGTAHIYEYSGGKESLDGKVLELLRVDGGWILVKVRADREADLRTGNYYGNDYSVAMSAWVNYLAPLLPTDLWNGPNIYFREATHSDIYRKQIAAVSQLKETIIQDYYKGFDCVVDLACGRGQDMSRFARHGVRKLIGVDQDAAALAEFSRRILSPKGPRNGIRIMLVKSDLLEASLPGKVLELTAGSAANGVVCNLAIHYMFADTGMVERLAGIIAQMTKSGSAVFSCTVLDGERVHNKIGELAQGTSWDLKENNLLKYSIRRDYASQELTAAGQQIGVLLPFSQNRYYQEFLVPADTLIGALQRRGFKHKESRNIDTKNQSDVDAEYLELFTCHVFVRTA